MPLDTVLEPVASEAGQTIPGGNQELAATTMTQLVVRSLDLDKRLTTARCYLAAGTGQPQRVCADHGQSRLGRPAAGHRPLRGTAGLTGPANPRRRRLSPPWRRPFVLRGGQGKGCVASADRFPEIRILRFLTKAQRAGNRRMAAIRSSRSKRVIEPAAAPDHRVRSAGTHQTGLNQWLET